MCGGHCFFLNYFKFFSLMLIRTFNSVMCVAHWSLCVPLFPIPSLLPPFPLLKISIPPDCSQLVTLICHLSYCHLCCCCFPDRFFSLYWFFVNFTSTPQFYSSPPPLIPNLQPPNREKNLVVEAVMCHSVSSFCLHFFACTCSCSDSLVCYEASGFCYSIHTRTSLGLL